jgi:hypothetical protein
MISPYLTLMRGQIRRRLEYDIIATGGSSRPSTASIKFQIAESFIQLDLKSVSLEQGVLAT